LLFERNPTSESDLHPNHLFRELIRKFGHGKVWHGEISCHKKNGERFWADTTIVPLLDENDNPQQYLSIGFDITGRKHSDEQSRHLFQAVEKTTDIVFITDRTGHIEYVNPAFETITGYGSDEAQGKTPSIMKSGKHDRAHYENLWGTILSGNVHRSTTINRRKNGELFYAEQTITPIKSDEGEITHFISVLKDITELLKRKEQEVSLRLAREVQQSYYRTTVTLPGFDIAGASHPADETGGDYFDFIRLPDGCLVIAIGDVSGHGISAALIMAETRAYLRSYARTCLDVGEIMTYVNRALADDLDQGRFVTLLVICLDPAKMTATFASAGHESGYLINPSGKVEKELLSNGPPLGLFPDREYASCNPIQLSTDQAIILLTDGITETPHSGDFVFGAHRAIEYFNAHRHEPAKMIAKSLCEAVERSVADHRLQDDVTSVILKVS
jgi:PAS domain S-box-containing protein